MQKEIIWINTEGLLVPRSSSKAAACLFVPYPVCRGRRDVDNQSPWQFLNLDSEQQRCVGHLLELLLNELVFCRLLEVLGFGDFVHKSQNLPSSLATPCPVKRGLEETKRQRLCDPTSQNFEETRASKCKWEQQPSGVWCQHGLKKEHLQDSRVEVTLSFTLLTETFLLEAVIADHSTKVI